MTLSKYLKTAWLALAVLGLSSVAQAQAPRGPPCIDRAQVVEHLRALFGEQEVGRGLAQGGFVFELFVAPSGTWTVVATTPKGMSCFVASGEAWEPAPKLEIFAGP